MEMFWFFQLWFHWACDSAYNSNFQFSLGRKLSHDSDFKSIASENQPWPPPTTLCKENLHNVLTRQICRDIENAFKTCRMCNLVLRVSLSHLLVLWVWCEWHNTLWHNGRTKNLKSPHGPDEDEWVSADKEQKQCPYPLGPLGHNL